MEEEAAPVMIGDEVKAAAVKMNEMADEVSTVLVERRDEITAWKLCLITKQHLMLEGPPGVAKSLFADEVFKRIKGNIVFFKKQLMTNTQTDEIFGPLSTKSYRDDEEYKVSIEGYLPSAHFAFLDEVYRAANMVLPAILGILNERTFQNGIEHIECPLHSAIATSNFVSENTELEAFHDRWLVRIKTLPLTGADARIKALKRYLSWNIGEPNREKAITLKDIAQLSKAMSGVVLGVEVLGLYEELVAHLRKVLPQLYISDRRFCQAFRLCLAQQVLDFGVSEQEEEQSNKMDLAALNSSRYGLIVVNEKDQNEAFESVYSRVVGSYVKDEQTLLKLGKLRNYVQQLERGYDEDMTPKERAKLYVKIKRAQSSIEAESQAPNTSVRMTSMLERISSSLRSLESSVNPNLDAKLVQEEIESLKKKKEQE